MSETYKVPAELKPIMRQYLTNRREELHRIEHWIQNHDFAKLRKIGHNLKGNGAAYGLPPISEFGKKFEELSIAQKPNELQATYEQYKKWLTELNVIFEQNS